MGSENTINPLAMLIPYALIFVIFYFLVIRPQKEKQSEFQRMLNDLKRNDEIVTNGGIHGTIVNIKETTLVLRIDENVKIEIDRSAVARIDKKGSTI